MASILNLPDIASAHGASLDHATYLVHWLMALLFVGWSVYFVYVIFRFRASANPQANYDGVHSHFSTYVEVGVVVAEAVLLVVFSIPLWSARVDAFPTEEDDPVVVRVVGEQFAWNVHYPGADGKFGRTAIDLIDVQSNPLGIDRQDPAGKDDITTVNQLHLPVDRPVIIHLSSKDVIHSFSLNEFRSKQDTIPGMSIPLHFTPTVTTREMRQQKGLPEYNYEIACAQLCGIGHYRMRGFVTIHEQDEFQAWLDEQAEYLGGEADEFWG